MFVRRTHFESFEGYDEGFTLSRGGGLVNHDFWQRACRTDGAQPLMLLGEGAFHQFHGGATTSRADVSIEALLEEYERVRGTPYEHPGIKPWLFGQFRPRVIPALASCVVDFMQDRDVPRCLEEIAERAGPPAKS